MTRTLLVLRAHRADTQTFAAYDRYAAVPGLEVLIACDERRGAVDMQARRKAGYSLQTLRDMGLLPHPKCGWRCGDYAYYLARQTLPDFDFYWLTEPDVWVNAADLHAFMASFAASDADFLASRLAPAHSGWLWHGTMADRYSDVFACIFPITRLSGRAIDHLHAARRAARRAPSEAVFASWPNDEVFAATELMNHGFTCLDLSDVRPGCYTPHSLRTGLPHDRETLLARPADGLIYHPVRDLAPWFAENSAWAEERGCWLRDNPGCALPGEHVARLFRLARTCLELPALRDAALAPLLFATVPDENGSSPWAGREAKRAEALGLLAEYFGVRGDEAPVARAHLVAGLPGEGADARPSVEDFAVTRALDLRRLPRRFALPYAVCFERRLVRFTVHPVPEGALGSDATVGAQRQRAPVVCDVGWDDLDAVFGEVAQSGTPWPGALHQLVADEPGFASLPERLQISLLRAVQLPAFVKRA
jgi:hypothetical protein